MKAALRKNEALLRGVDKAHELADVVAANAQVHALPPLLVGQALTPH